MGVDTDPQAVEVARTNVGLNNVTNQVDLAVCGPDEVAGVFDLITANLFLNAHLALAGEYLRLTAPGGTVILSGLRNDQAQTAADRMTDEGFMMGKCLEKDGWTALLLNGTRLAAQ
ncbi:MAG: 50S ribosomal protein L11 methyltransferase [Nitrospinota bacterium]|nr:50S ribosomal protein L11 methyltransferase [Nitrospinota bacterium]